MLTSAGVATLAYVPLVALTLRTGATSILTANAPPSTTEGIHILEELTAGVAPDFFAVTGPLRIVTVIGLLCFVAAGAELLSRTRRAAGEFETVCLGVAMSWLFVPLLLDILFSLAYRSIFNSSFLLQSVPAGALVMAFVFARFLPKGVSLLLTFAIVALLVTGLVPTYGVSYEQWSQASREDSQRFSGWRLPDSQQARSRFEPCLLLLLRRWYGSCATPGVTSSYMVRCAGPDILAISHKRVACRSRFDLQTIVDRHKPRQSRPGHVP